MAVKLLCLLWGVSAGMILGWMLCESMRHSKVRRRRIEDAARACDLHINPDGVLEYKDYNGYTSL
jgi:hypothetical protein